MLINPPTFATFDKNRIQEKYHDYTANAYSLIKELSEDIDANAQFTVAKLRKFEAEFLQVQFNIVTMEIK